MLEVEDLAGDADELGPAGAFFFPDPGELDPKAIAGKLVGALDEFQHLRIGEASILFLMRAEPQIKSGRRTLGLMALPRFQGSLGSLASWLLVKACGDTLPDFLMILDNEWWVQATPMQREALVYHELCHADHARDKEGEPKFTDEGDPVWGIKGHDIEEFNAVVRRYGAWLDDITAFIAAAREGRAA